MADTRRVLVVGGGVAALAAAVALVEQNKKQGRVRFEITVMTSDNIWGGRASSWPGGGVRFRYEKQSGETADKAAEETARMVAQGMSTTSPEYVLKAVDFHAWPPDVPLNHGFHAVFDETTYVNFWKTLDLAGLDRGVLKQNVLISNDLEILVHESETANVCRLQIHPDNLYPYPFNSHLTRAAFEVWRHGGWSIPEIVSFGLKVVLPVRGFRNFDDLAGLDNLQQISFQKWCRDRGVRESVFNKMMFKFLFQGTYIAPNTMDATSALMGLWVILRHMDAARWYYINGGITELLMAPIAKFLEEEGEVMLRTRHELTSLVVDGGFSRVIGFEEREAQREDHPVSRKQYAESFDYYLLTLPLDSLVCLFENSKPKGGSPFSLLDGFPDIATLKGDKRFVQPAGTVNLQAWFRDPGLLSDEANVAGDYKNVISGLEPLCVLVDYKNILPMYKDDPRFTGSVLEINGSLQELQSPEHYGYFECDTRFGEPHEAKTIEFARTIMIDIARRYNFKKLLRAVEENAFLEFSGDWPNRHRWPYDRPSDKLPPFLWKNTDPYNRFFVTGPGTLQYRPWVWRREYPENYLNLRRNGYPGPKGYPDNLVLAGDWTRNGFDIPSMEGAARSGRMAALAVIKKALGRDATADPTQASQAPDPELIRVYDPDEPLDNR